MGVDDRDHPKRHDTGEFLGTLARYARPQQASKPAVSLTDKECCHFTVRIPGFRSPAEKIGK